MAKKPTPLRDALAERIRVVLDGRSVREVPMFGGLSFMVDERLAVSAGREGTLLVRVDPDRYDELVERPGASEAIMGQRTMAPNWLVVDADALASDEALADWVTVGLEAPA